MTVDGERFITEMLKAIRSEIGEIKADVRDLKLRQTVLEGHLSGIMASVSLVNDRLDRLQGDMGRVKRRLDLVDAE